MFIAPSIFPFSLLFFLTSIITILTSLPISISASIPEKVKVGADIIFTDEFAVLLKGKKVGLITNQTAINASMVSTIDLFKKNAQKKGFTLTALFAPEHGITGAYHADTFVGDLFDSDGIPIFSLHGKLRRPSDEMLQRINVLVYDIQDIGSRSYTYMTTLFYAMEEAAKKNIPVIVLDRPNPINGTLIDGPMLKDKWRSFVGYINVPYCHGMTIGELAKFFNQEYKIGCKLHVVPMHGWKRNMSFEDTGLTWVPTSPHIPEASTVWFYPTTGMLGELQIVNMGVGYTLPFKLVGASWIDASAFAKTLNAKQMPGVYFHPTYYRPFYGTLAKKECQGVLIIITDKALFKPVTTEYLIFSVLKTLFPKEFMAALNANKSRKDMFCKITGTEEIYSILEQQPQPFEKLTQVDKKERKRFLAKRSKYLIPQYN